MQKAILDVAAFHMATDTPNRNEPTWPCDSRVRLRTDLICEEYTELRKAILLRNMVDTADAIADLIYVLIGAALEFGIPLEAVWNEVQRSNMAKVDPATGKVRKREDGKVLKPEGWTPPDIEAVLRGALR